MGIHLQTKDKCRNVFGDSNIKYHDFNNDDALTFKDKYTALLQQELQNLYWCLHDPITTKSYQIYSEMDVETMPHEIYFSGFPIDQYLHDRVTPANLSPKLLAYDKPIDLAEMPCISTCTEMTTEDTNVPTQNDKYPWLDPDDK